MNVSDQVMVEMLSSHAPSLHSLVSIITCQEKYCQGMGSHSLDISACQIMSYSLCGIIVRGCQRKILSHDEHYI
jgi:hypothetical protein